VPRVAGAEEITVEGEVERVTFESATSGFRVIKIRIEGRKDRLAVVGSFPPVPAGARVRVRGRLVVDKRHGEQLSAEAVTELTPTTQKGLVRYLASGAIKGIGPKTAERIVDTFGDETLRVLDEEPHRLAEVSGLGGRRAAQVAKAWAEQKGLREIMVFLQAHGATPALAARIHKRYGADAATVVARQPYRLAMEVWGIGFGTADRIAQGLGVAKDAPERVQAGLLQATTDESEAGHVHTPKGDLFLRAAALLDLPRGMDDVPDDDARALLERALTALVADGHLATDERDGATNVYAAPLWHAERRVAKRLAALARGVPRPLDGAERAIARFEQRGGQALALEQRQAVLLAAKAQALVVTGGPGVGKTTVVRALLALFDHAGLVTRLAAPTGRAAKRMSEATGREAQTLHRLLEFEPARAVFKRDAKNPLDADVLVVDEASMVDLPMADALLQAVGAGTRLVLVGDVDQLPSVGPGAVLRDVIASGVVPTVRLVHVFRQSKQSLIVENAHRINAGDLPETSAADAPGADFFVVERKDPEQARATVVELVSRRIPQRFGLDPLRDVQVLVPMHRGEAGAAALNAALQEALNPLGKPAGRNLRVGDKVMQLKNDYDKDVWNGDVGVVAGADEDGPVVVRFEDGRSVEYAPEDTEDLALAYACTIHKSQGSEYPAVVVVLLTSHFVMLSRNLLYTAVTRGKRLVVLVADGRALRVAVREDRRGERRSSLAQRLRESEIDAER
jgi:exodeoxyribonuclease V alpha subunit